MKIGAIICFTISFILIFICLINQGYSMTYDEIISTDKAVLRFTATWCPPCRALAPVFDEVAGEHPNVKTFVIDVDEHRDIAAKFGIKGIPTLMKIENGSVTLQKSGALPKPEVDEFFE